MADDALFTIAGQEFKVTSVGSGLPGAADLVPSDGVRQLDPEWATWEAMLGAGQLHGGTPVLAGIAGGRRPTSRQLRPPTQAPETRIPLQRNTNCVTHQRKGGGRHGCKYRLVS